MKLQKTLALSLGIIALLPGCGGSSMLDWADETFYQGKMHQDYQDAIKPFLKGMRLYDLFNTVAIFDALWLSDTVRTAYAQIYARAVGKNEEGYIDFLRRELSANTYFVSFYVLSQNHIPLDVSPAWWSIHLEIDGKKYLPAEIKLVELAPEYVRFFDKRITNHKRPYEIRFDRKDTEGNDILAGKKEMILVFSDPHYYGTMAWNLDEDNKAVLPKLTFVSIAQETKDQEAAKKAADEALEAKYDKKTPRKGRKVEKKQKLQETQEKAETTKTAEPAIDISERPMFSDEFDQQPALPAWESQPELVVSSSQPEEALPVGLFDGLEPERIELARRQQEATQDVQKPLEPAIVTVKEPAHTQNVPVMSEEPQAIPVQKMYVTDDDGQEHELLLEELFGQDDVQEVSEPVVVQEMQAKGRL